MLSHNVVFRRTVLSSCVCARSGRTWPSSCMSLAHLLLSAGITVRFAVTPCILPGTESTFFLLTQFQRGLDVRRLGSPQKVLWRHKESGHGSVYGKAPVPECGSGPCPPETCS